MGEDVNLSSNRASKSRKIQNGIVDPAEVACPRWLVLLRAQGERVDIDSGVWAAGVVLVWLHGVEVRSFALREAVLSVELQFGCDHGILSPAVHAVGASLVAGAFPLGMRPNRAKEKAEKSGRCSQGSSEQKTRAQ